MIPANHTIDKVEKIIDIISNHLDTHEGCNCITEILQQFYNKKELLDSEPTTHASQNHHDQGILTNG